MASLDQAFIKAYRQQVSPAGAIPLDTSGTESLAEALEDRPLREAKRQTAAARHTEVLSVLEAERPHPQVTNPAPSQSCTPIAEPDEQVLALEGDQCQVPSFICSVAERSRESFLPNHSSAPTGVAVAADVPATVGPTAPTGRDEVEAGTFRPLLQVPRIVASAVGERLKQRAAAELDCLAHALLALAKQGKTAAGFAASAPGQGITTLLGAVALRLAERGVSVALVDANLDRPQLASELGLLPEYGWERALVSSIPSEELVIESVEQPIALMPLCGKLDAGGVLQNGGPFQEAMATLREHYDLVLVDLGASGNAPVEPILGTLDTVLLVRDMRAKASQDVFALYRTLVRSKVHVAGIIESFGRGE